MNGKCGNSHFPFLLVYVTLVLRNGMIQYIYNTPQILNDSIFTLFGGKTGTSTVAQREASYVMAEMQAYEYLNSYLTPTVVTGTHYWTGKNPLVLNHGWIQAVGSVTFLNYNGDTLGTLDTFTGFGLVRNVRYGYLDVARGLGICNCSGGGVPYSIQVSYTSGLDTGTYTSPIVLSALTMASQISLNEMDTSLSNETVADAGIDYFINNGYHEKRKTRYLTAFGDSPMANRVALLLKSLRARPSVSII